jgi:hypothetical protein
MPRTLSTGDMLTPTEEKLSVPRSLLRMFSRSKPGLSSAPSSPLSSSRAVFSPLSSPLSSSRGLSPLSSSRGLTSRSGSGASTVGYPRAAAPAAAPGVPAVAAAPPTRCENPILDEYHVEARLREKRRTRRQKLDSEELCSPPSACSGVPEDVLAGPQTRQPEQLGADTLRLRMLSDESSSVPWGEVLSSSVGELSAQQRRKSSLWRFLTTSSGAKPRVHPRGGAPAEGSRGPGETRINTF